MRCGALHLEQLGGFDHLKKIRLPLQLQQQLCSKSPKIKQIKQFLAQKSVENLEQHLSVICRRKVLKIENGFQPKFKFS